MLKLFSISIRLMHVYGALMECVKHSEKHLLQYYLATKHTETRLTSNLTFVVTGQWVTTWAVVHPMVVLVTGKWRKDMLFLLHKYLVCWSDMNRTRISSMQLELENPHCALFVQILAKLREGILVWHKHKWSARAMPTPVEETERKASVCGQTVEQRSSAVVVL